jgi:prepilin-type processing-associated H-X9-DG protein
MLLPALSAARQSSRRAACQSNLRQFGIGMQDHVSRSPTASFCSGAFDWKLDGCVTEVGWVADMVDSGIPVGEMLCPANVNQISSTYNDLLSLDTDSYEADVDLLGSPSGTAPDGTPIVNPCRLIAETPLAPGSEERRQHVEEKIFNEHYNTNYTASWWLVRSAVVLDSSGNLKSDRPGHTPSLASRCGTLGPLTQERADAAAAASSFIPLLGCGAAGAPLRQAIGPHGAGVITVPSMTAGPVVNPTMMKIGFPEGTSYEGPNGWWAGWTSTTLQDYRNFAPVHRGVCNLLFADGSVRGYADTNEDGVLNNGFTPEEQNGFADDSIELVEEEVFSGWTLRQKQR